MHGKNDTAIARNLFDLGEYYYSQGDTSANDAIKVFDRFMNGKPAAALPVLNDCLKLASNRFSQDKFLLLRINMVLAETFHKLGKNPDEFVSLEKARTLADALLAERDASVTIGDPNNPLIEACVDVYEKLAQFYLTASDFPNARLLAEKGLTYKKMLDPKNANKSHVLESIVASCNASK